MKKTELEQKIEELSAYNNALKINIDVMSKEHENEIKKLKADFKKQMYQEWKEKNAEFLSQYIKEFIVNELSLKLSRDDGYLEVEISDSECTLLSDSTYVRY